MGRSWLRTICILAAIATGWIYLALVEYAAGMEIFRLCLVFLVTNEARAWQVPAKGGPCLAKLAHLFGHPRSALRSGASCSSRASAKRPISARSLAALQSDPLSTGLHWLVNLLLSFVNVSLVGLGRAADEQLLLRNAAGSADRIPGCAGRGPRELALPEPEPSPAAGSLKIWERQAGRSNPSGSGSPAWCSGSPRSSSPIARSHSPTSRTMRCRLRWAWRLPSPAVCSP